MIKQTNYAMKNDIEFADKVNRNVNDGDDYHGETEVYHYLEVLRDIIGFDKIKELSNGSLKGKKIGAYYGCLLLRPSSVMKTDDAENPRMIEDLIKAAGAEPVVYGMRNECCGGYVTLEDRALSEKQSRAVYESAKNAGAEALVTACPLCRYNLVKNGANVPVLYFTELLHKALSEEI